VAVIGAGEPDPGAEEAAERVGRELARAGGVVVCGGLGGVMAAACRGARDEGGPTVGILPGLDRAEANPWVEVAVPTGLGEARNALVVRAADALVAVGGGFGTLAEIGLALKGGKTVVGLGTWRLSRDGGDEVAAVLRAATPEDAAALALAAAGPPAGR
jgi:uncharacterized protein (TIGR00725 family)